MHLKNIGSKFTTFDPENANWNDIKAVILGQSINSSEQYNCSIINGLFFFSYRQFREPLVQGSLSLKNDTSRLASPDWGCSLRCVQMMFARCLYKRNEKRNETIQLFLDNSACPLSIHNICQKGIEKFKAKINEYWTPLTALLSAKEAFKDTKNVYKLSQEIDFFTFHNNTINFNEAILAYKCDKSLVIFVVGMFGDKAITEPNFRCLKELMNSRFTVGMVGGIGSRALYIVGNAQDNFLGLDPHFTQMVALSHQGSHRQFAGVKLKLH